MSKVAVVYWSGTGNTEAMAKAVEEGIREKGAEVLEETEFDPMFTAVESSLSGKKIAIFGSYGWGDGEWLREWETRCNNAGAVLAAEPLMVNEAPDDDGIASCKALGASLV